MQNCYVVSVKELCEIIGISRSHCYKMINNGRIPVVQFGRRIVIPKTVVDELLNTCK